MQTAYVDPAVVRAIQSDYQARAQRHAGEGPRVSVFSRMGWTRRVRDHEESLPTARTAAGRVPRFSHGVTPT